MGQAVGNMEERSAWASECGYRGSMPATPAEQLTQRSYVEDEAVKPMTGVSDCVELECADGEDDNRCSLLDTCMARRVFFEGT